MRGPWQQGMLSTAFFRLSTARSSVSASRFSGSKVVVSHCLTYAICFDQSFANRRARPFLRCHRIVEKVVDDCLEERGFRPRKVGSGGGAYDHS
jgi:hypothetical protein